MVAREIAETDSHAGSLFARLVAVAGWVLVLAAVYYDEVVGPTAASIAEYVWYGGVALQFLAFFLWLGTRRPRRF